MTDNPITTNVALEVAKHEGIVRETYFDSVKMPTWSVGLTNASGHNVTRYWRNPQSLGRCIEVYIWALDNYAERVRRTFDGHALSEKQFAAALSFHWNTGNIHTAEWVKSWLNGEEKRAYDQFMNWRSPPEIIPRREQERNLFFEEGPWSHRGKLVEWARVRDNGTIDWSERVEHEAFQMMTDAVQVHMFGDDAQEEPPAVPRPFPVTRDELVIWRDKLTELSREIQEVLRRMDQ